MRVDVVVSSVGAIFCLSVLPESSRSVWPRCLRRSWCSRCSAASGGLGRAWNRYELLCAVRRVVWARVDDLCRPDHGAGARRSDAPEGAAGRLESQHAAAGGCRLHQGCCLECRSCLACESCLDCRARLIAGSSVGVQAEERLTPLIRIAGRRGCSVGGRFGRPLLITELITGRALPGAATLASAPPVANVRRPEPNGNDGCDPARSSP